MALTYFRHQLHLHGQKIVAVLIIFLLGLSSPAFSQGRIKTENLPGYEERLLRWGFSLGLNTSWYQLEHSRSYVNRLQTDSAYSANAVNRVGFNVNFIATYRLAPNFLVRFQPGVGYHGRAIDYKGDLRSVSTDDYVVQEVNTFSLEMPLLVKYESLRRKNSQMYFIAGVKPSFVVGGIKKGNPELLQVGSSDFTIEYGVGFDMFYPFFKFSPELRYSRGITNLHEPAHNNLYYNTMQRLTTNTITLYLNFE
ncbi:type IX secretion/gliding motility protein PorT/SprT [Rufibacter roseus]|uniref:Porin family protein n=1 Tax=Rufibacter roseus TaxID=1567108 RepID=A0ABW2DLI7_9BACT|nr:porin family protein [Rufibacter roseus]